MSHFTEQRIRHILSLTPAVIYTCLADGDFRATFVSDNIQTLLGYSAKECLDNPTFWHDNIHADDRDRILADYPSFYQADHYVHEYRFRKKDGDYLWLLDEFRLVRDANGEPLEIIGSWLDISDRKKTEVAMQRSEALFRDFFNANPAATIITSPDGVIHMVNPAFARATDFSMEEVVGRTSMELGFWRDLEDRQRMIAAINESGRIDQLESQFHGKDGKILTCLVSCRAIEFEGETRILSIVTDVTEQKRAEAAMRKLDQAKSDFISTAAHELRTPLVAVVGYAELLENAAGLPLADEEQQHYLSIIRNNAEILNHLVDDLLDIGRIQVGRALGITRKPHDLQELIDKVAGSMRLQSARHDIVIDHDQPLAERFQIDSSRIVQVFNNLLDNAIKYSPDGGMIRIRTSLDNDHVVVTISDQGIGMSAEQVASVFDRFYRAETRSEKTPGLGLGLCIVEQIISDHGGEITVSSSPGAGTCVRLTLPRG